MAKSKAKKFRVKMEREGKRNPELNRSPFAFTDLRTRKTKTKKDVLYGNQTFHDGGKDGSFYFGQKINLSSFRPRTGITIF